MLKKKGFNNQQNNTLCIVAGGSGGHITPALVLGKKWLNENPTGKIIFFGNSKQLDQTIISSETAISHTVQYKLNTLPGKKAWLYPLFLYQLCTTFFKAFYFLYKFKPNKIITTGGLLAIPICLAAALLSISIELNELNVIPGKATRSLAFLAKDIRVTFKASKPFFKKYKCSVFQYPLRFSSDDKAGDKNKIIDTINSKQKSKPPFTSNRKTLFLLGGSQGSLFLNNLLKQWIKSNNTIHNIQIIHQTGSFDITNWKEFYENKKIPAYFFSYDKDIRDLYLLADIVICRGGAGTLFELEFFNKKGIIIPLQGKALNHQVENAYEMQHRYPELFTVLEQNKVRKNFNIFNKSLTKNFLLTQK